MRRDGIALTSVWKPWTWSAALYSIAIGLASILATSTLAWISKRLKRTPDQSSDLASHAEKKSSEFERMKTELDSMVHQLEQMPEPISREQYEEWDNRGRQLRSTIRVKQQAGKISSDNAAVLLAAVRSLRLELANITVSSSIQTMPEASRQVALDQRIGSGS